MCKVMRAIADGGTAISSFEFADAYGHECGDRQGRSAGCARTPGAQPRTRGAKWRSHDPRDACDPARSWRARRNAARRRCCFAEPSSPTLCMHGIAAGTTASMIAELPAPQSDKIPVMWASLAAPCTSIVFPLFVNGTLPPILAAGGEKFSSDSPWWRFKRSRTWLQRRPTGWHQSHRNISGRSRLRCSNAPPRLSSVHADSIPPCAISCSTNAWRKISCASSTRSPRRKPNLSARGLEG